MSKMEFNNKSQTATIHTEELENNPLDTIAPYHSNRSLRACIFDGWRIFALNFKRYLGQLSIAALLTGIGVGLVCWLASKLYAEHIIPTKLYIQAGNDSDLIWEVFKLQVMDYVMLAVDLIICIAFCSISKGILWTQVAHYSKEDTLSSKKFLLPNKEIFQSSSRILTYNATIFVAMFIPLAIVGAIAYLTGVLYLLLLIIPICIFVGVLAVPGRYAYMIERASLTQALRTTWQKGLHYWGGFFLITLLTAIPLTAVNAVFVLPFTTFPLSIFADTTSMITGEVTGLPNYFTAIGLLVAVVAFGCIFLVTTLQTWALALKSAATFLPASKNIEDKR